MPQSENNPIRLAEDHETCTVMIGYENNHEKNKGYKMHHMERSMPNYL
jgi:hypothetical protein